MTRRGQHEQAIDRTGSRTYAQASKRRERLTGPHLKAYDRALDWARMGTSDALTQPEREAVAA